MSAPSQPTGTEGPLSIVRSGSRLRQRTTGMGHEDQFPPPSLRDRCGSREGTFAGTRTNGRHAPIPDLRGLNRTYLSKLEKGASYPGLEINAKLSTGWRSCERFS